MRVFKIAWKNARKDIAFSQVILINTLTKYAKIKLYNIKSKCFLEKTWIKITSNFAKRGKSIKDSCSYLNFRFNFFLRLTFQKKKKKKNPMTSLLGTRMKISITLGSPIMLGVTRNYIRKCQQAAVLFFLDIHVK